MTELTARRHLALVLGPLNAADAARSELLAPLWAAHRGRLLAEVQGAAMPWAFWRFEVGVPDDLRGSVSPLRPLGEPDPDPTLEARRAVWLADNRPEEAR